MSEPLHIREIFSSIQGEGLLAGRRQIFVRLTDCNLDCRYCDTDYRRLDSCCVEDVPGSGVFRQLPQPLALEQVAEIVGDWCRRAPGAHHSVSITGGEPLLHAGILAGWLPAIRTMLPIHLESNGSMPEALSAVVRFCDYISMDIKLPSTAGCGGHLWELHRSFLSIAQSAVASVKVVVGEQTPDGEIRQVCELINAAGRGTPLFLQPVTRAGGGTAISSARLLELQQLAASLVTDVRVIPQMHLMLGAL